MQGSKRFATQDNVPASRHSVTHDDQAKHLSEIANQVPTSKQLRDLTESQRRELGYGSSAFARPQNSRAALGSQYRSTDKLPSRAMAVERGYDPYSNLESRNIPAQRSEVKSSRRMMLPQHQEPLNLISSKSSS